MKNVELFQNRSVHESYRLEVLITLERVNNSVVKANCSGVVNFHCM